MIINNTTKLLCAAMAAGLILVGCVTAHLWEYRTRTTQERIGKSVLDEYGKSGWELVQFERIPVVKNTNHVAITNIEYEYIFKRPKK